MDKKFKHQEHEDSLYKKWEKGGYLKPGKGRPFTILMPPPNANASLHAGHGMYVIDDILIRWKRLTGYASLWIPGLDHAGFETQYVYEKILQKKGKSRLDFDRKTLYDRIYAFVKENSGLIYTQFRRLGFLADWERSVFTLDGHVIAYIYETFKKMFNDGYVYRDDYIVNYCTHCGTSLAQLEVGHVERVDPLYYIRYGPFTLATVRPETKFGDTAVAVHPADRRYAKWIGKEIEVEGLLGKFRLKVIADEYVDPKFGTGVVKVTPGHDPNDYEMGKRHNLEIKRVIDWNGKLTDLAGPYRGLSVPQARKRVAEDLEKQGLIDKIDNKYTHAVSTCYKCGRDLEPLTVPNWFLKVDDLKREVVKVVKADKVRFHPKKYKKQMLAWLDDMHDWPISRQIVWGIRIPVWYEVDRGASNIWVWWIDKSGELRQGSVRQFLEDGVSLGDIEAGLQKVHALTGPSAPKHVISDKRPKGDYLPETDTFDTWFSSGQWPLVTLRDEEFKTRFPTDFMGTLSDILKFWISRMILFSLYLKHDVPFKDVYLWSMVADERGQKMSKSRGNVVDPIKLVDQYGADAFRAGLLFGIAQGGQVNLSEDRVRSMRNFANKLWNMGRFIYLNKKTSLRHSGKRVARAHPESQGDAGQASMTLRKLDEEFDVLKKKVIKYMDSYRFSKALDELYEFTWHRFADFYIEELKEAMQSGSIEAYGVLERVYLETLVLLHPFMPFVTEAVWKGFNGAESSILNSKIKSEK